MNQKLFYREIFILLESNHKISQLQMAEKNSELEAIQVQSLNSLIYCLAISIY